MFPLPTTLNRESEWVSERGWIRKLCVKLCLLKVCNTIKRNGSCRCQCTSIKRLQHNAFQMVIWTKFMQPPNNVQLLQFHVCSDDAAAAVHSVDLLNATNQMLYLPTSLSTFTFNFNCLIIFWAEFPIDHIRHMAQICRKIVPLNMLTTTRHESIRFRFKSS